MVSDNERDVFCSFWSSNCTACVLAGRESEDRGGLSAHCQWVGGNPSLCIARPQGNATTALSAWIAAHSRVTWAGQTAVPYHGAVPRCRILARDVSQCDAVADDFCYDTLPSCGSCLARGPTCGFCGERIFSSGAGIDSAPPRCVTSGDVSSGDAHPCSVPCFGQESIFSFMVPNGSQGMIEYPLWGRFGLTYTQHQTCSWQFGELFVDTAVKGLLTQHLAKNDEILLIESGHNGGTPSHAMDSNSELSLSFSIYGAPVTMEFVSDGEQESFGFSLVWSTAPFSAVGFANHTSALEQGPWSSDWSGTAMLLLWLVTAFAAVISLCIFVDRVRGFHSHQMTSEKQPKQCEWSDKVYPEERISDNCFPDMVCIDALKSAVRPSLPSSPSSSLTSTLTTLCNISWPRPVALLRPACPAMTRGAASKPTPPQSLTVNAAPIARAQLVQLSLPQALPPWAMGEVLASTPSEVSLEALPVPQPPAGPPPEGTRAFARWLRTRTVAWSPRGEGSRSVVRANGMIPMAAPVIRTTGLRAAARIPSPVSSPLHGASDSPPHSKDLLQV